MNLHGAPIGSMWFDPPKDVANVKAWQDACNEVARISGEKLPYPKPPTPPPSPRVLPPLPPPMSATEAIALLARQTGFTVADLEEAIRYGRTIHRVHDLPDGQRVNLVFSGEAVRREDIAEVARVEALRFRNPFGR